MLEVGRITGGSFAWQRAHFGAWCVVSSPLILGLDLDDTRTLASIIPFITNPEAIAVNQNWAGHPGQLVAEFAPDTASGWTYALGALMKGHDRPGWPRNATLAEAQEACGHDLGCGGITYHSSDPNPTGSLKVYLKDEAVGSNDDQEWSRYTRVAQVATPHSPAWRTCGRLICPAGLRPTGLLDETALSLMNSPVCMLWLVGWHGSPYSTCVVVVYLCTACG
jgi:hypothetical protein